MEEFFKGIPSWASGGTIGIIVYGLLQGYKLLREARHQDNADDLSVSDRISQTYEKLNNSLNERILQQNIIIEDLRKKQEESAERCHDEIEALRVQMHAQELHYTNRLNDKDREIARKDFELRTAQQNLQHIGVLKDHLPLSFLRDIIAEREAKDVEDYEDQ